MKTNLKESFKGNIPAAVLSKGYRAGLLLTTLGMVLLPLVYFAIIGLIAYFFIYRWGLYENTYHLTGSARKLSINPVLIVIGIVFVVFMIKPIFVRRPKGVRPITLDMEKEPQLKTFIQEICTQVGVAFPAEVRVDNLVNASAGFRSGMLSIMKKDLVLTIGLPLATGLTMTQLGGVIAHEFGHFAQRASMACTYIIRSINHWFSRVVFDRDILDVWLDNMDKHVNDFRWTLFKWFMQFFIWVTRKILHGLMLLGHIISCYQARQMEFDADYYETQLGGSESFAQTSRELMYLSGANSEAFEACRRLYQDHKLVDNYVLLVKDYRLRQSDEFVKRVEEYIAGEKTGRYDTHPCTRDRIRHAAELHATGIFHVSKPAEELFSDFPSLSRDITKHYYQSEQQIDLGKIKCVPTQEILKTLHQEEAAEKALVRLAGGYVLFQYPLMLPLESESDTDLKHLLASAKENRTWLDENTEKLNTLLDENQKLWQKEINLQAAIQLANTGFDVSPYGLEIEAEELKQAQDTLVKIQKELEETIRTDQDRDRHAVAWINAALHAAESPTVKSHMEQPDEAEELIRLLKSYQDFMNVFPNIKELITLDISSGYITNHQKELQEHKDFHASVTKTISELSAVYRKTLAAAQFPYPFEHAQGNITVADYIKDATPSTHPADQVSVAIGQVRFLYYRMLERIFFIAERVLNALEKSV